MENGNNISNQSKTTSPSLMDLGKQLLEYAREGKTAKVHEMMCRGAPFTSDWVFKINFQTKKNLLELVI